MREQVRSIENPNRGGSLKPGIPTRCVPHLVLVKHLSQPIFILRVAALLLFSFSGCTAVHASQAPRGTTAQPTSEWDTVELPSRPMNIAENKGVLWVCGADELIANSTDGGKTWSVVHSVKNGGVLLTIGFADERFGYAAGTNGALLFTNDKGKTWNRIRAPAQVTYEASFSDEMHGLIQTPKAIYMTSDGGATWAAVGIDFGSDDLKGFSHIAVILALDAKHMMVVLSGGNAAYYPCKFLVTKDGGLDWKVTEIPSTGLTRLTKHDGEYWFAGGEVIEKDKPGGGYSVPLVMHSADGQDWTHLPRWSQKGFSVCNVQGCLYWDGAGVELPPANPVHYWTFPAEKVVTAKWAIAKDRICSVGTNLRCASVAVTQVMPPYVDISSPIATPIFPPALDAPPSQGPQCISCDVERVIVTHDYQGIAEARLEVHIAQNGLVEEAEVVSATNPEIGERLAAMVRNWIFLLPIGEDGIVHPVITHVNLRVQAIKSK
jgi:Photosynthesis system II assembly factor YCF48